MTMLEHDKDGVRIDALVRAAARRPTDEIRLAGQVLTRIRDDQAGLFGLFAHGLRLAPAAFAMLLIATPIVIARYPGSGEDGIITAIALGAALLTDPSVESYFGSESLE